MDFSGLGGVFKQKTIDYLNQNKLPADYYGNTYDYDLIVTCTDLIIQKNIRDKKVVLVQEGMTDPKNLMFYFVKWFRLPRYLASSTTTGLSDRYLKFCVASQGYRDFFIKNGVDANKIVVTGIPNYDNCQSYINNDFPYKNYVLAATSDSRETFKYENRKKFVLNAKRIAKGRQLIFKLHPNENSKRAIKEIDKWAPGALVFTDGNVHEMIANCDVLVTKYSTVVYTGLALGKEVFSDFDVEQLKKVTPEQNYGTSAQNIANVCKKVIENDFDQNKYNIIHQNILDKFIRKKDVRFKRDKESIDN